MKKKTILLVACMTLLCGCGKTIPVLDNGEEAVVSFGDGSMISVNDLYNELKDTYARGILTEMIDKKILEDKYKDKLDEAKTYAENYISSIKYYFQDDDGNYDEDSLISYLQQNGYSSIELFQESVRLNYLSKLAVEDYTESTITDKQIEKYYKNEVVPDREVSHILIIPEVTDTMTDSEKTEKEEEALATAKSIIAKLKKGEKFEDLAKEYSDDASTSEDGGSLGAINKGTYGSDQFDEEVYNLKVGSYSTTPVKTSKGYEIIYVTNELEKKELDELKDSIITTLRDELLESDATLNVTAMIELRKEYGVDIIDSEIEKQYNKYMDNLMDSAIASNANN